MRSVTHGGAYDSMADGRSVAAAYEYHLRVNNTGEIDADRVRVRVVSTEPSDAGHDLPTDLEWRGPSGQTEKRIPAGGHAYAELSKFVLLNDPEHQWVTTEPILGLGRRPDLPVKVNLELWWEGKCGDTGSVTIGPLLAVDQPSTEE
jgi:hypothetical protein